MAANLPSPLLAAMASAQEAAVAGWQPESVEGCDIFIERGGRWRFASDELTADQVTKLAALLGRNGSAWVLRTPHVAYSIEVQDAPFVATHLEVVGEGTAQSIIFTTNVGERVELGPARPFRFRVDSLDDEPWAYVRVREGIDAILAPAVYEQLARILVTDDSSTMLGVWSGGRFMPLCKASAVFQQLLLEGANACCCCDVVHAHGQSSLPDADQRSSGRQQLRATVRPRQCAHSLRKACTATHPRPCQRTR